MSKKQKQQAVEQEVKQETATTTVEQPKAEDVQPTAEELAAKVAELSKQIAETKPATPSKQDATFNLLKSKWTERGVDLSKMTTTLNGKTLQIKVDETWPVVEVGAAGGVNLPAIRSYPKAFEAAVEADKLLAKQNERDAKKAAPKEGAGSKPAPSTEELRKQIADLQAKLAAQSSEKKEETPAERKEREHAAIEEKLQVA